MGVDYDAMLIYGVTMDEEQLKDLFKKYSGCVDDDMDDEEQDDAYCQYLEQYYDVCQVINSYVDYSDTEFYMGIELPSYMTDEQVRIRITQAMNDFWPKVVNDMFPDMPTEVAIKTFKPTFQTILRIW